MVGVGSRGEVWVVLAAITFYWWGGGIPGLCFFYGFFTRAEEEPEAVSFLVLWGVLVLLACILGLFLFFISVASREKCSGCRGSWPCSTGLPDGLSEVVVLLFNQDCFVEQGV